MSTLAGQDSVTKQLERDSREFWHSLGKGRGWRKESIDSFCSLETYSDMYTDTYAWLVIRVVRVQLLATGRNSIHSWRKICLIMPLWAIFVAHKLGVFRFILF